MAMEMSIEEAFRILNINDKMNFGQMRSAYRIMAKKYHPDVVDNKENEAMIIKVNLAWERVRKEYPKEVVTPKKEPSSPFTTYTTYQDTFNPVLEKNRSKLRMYTSNSFYDLLNALQSVGSNINYNEYYNLVNQINKKLYDNLNGITMATNQLQLDNIKKQVNAYIFDFCLKRKMAIFSTQYKIDFYNHIMNNQNYLTNEELNDIIRELKGISQDSKEYDRLIEKYNDLLNQADPEFEKIKKDILLEIQNMLKQTIDYRDKDKIKKATEELVNMLNGRKTKEQKAEIIGLRDRIFFDLISGLNIKPLHQNIKYEVYELLRKFKNDMTLEEYNSLLTTLRNASDLNELKIIEKRIKKSKEKKEYLISCKNKMQNELRKKVETFDYYNYIEDAIYRLRLDPMDIPLDDMTSTKYEIKKLLILKLNQIDKLTDIDELRTYNVDDMYDEMLRKLESKYGRSKQK